MLTLALGLAMLALLLWGARSFSRASVASVKGLLAWVAALGGLTLAAGLFLTGRGAAAVSGLVLIGPLAWSWWKNRQGSAQPGPAEAAPAHLAPDQ